MCHVQFLHAKVLNSHMFHQISMILILCQPLHGQIRTLTCILNSRDRAKGELSESIKIVCMSKKKELSVFFHCSRTTKTFQRKHLLKFELLSQPSHLSNLLYTCIFRLRIPTWYKITCMRQGRICKSYTCTGVIIKYSHATVNPVSSQPYPILWTLI